MIIDSSTVATLLQASNFLQQVTNQFVVKPFGSVGIAGYLFDVLDDEDVQLQADITDHYIENNSAIQDHIALRPERFTLRGFVGELYDKSGSTLATLENILDKATNVVAMIPSFADQATQFYQDLGGGDETVGGTINQVQSLYGMFQNAITTNTRQQAAYNYFYSLWQARQLVTVETPWSVFDNMAIESVRAFQRGSTRIISDFSVTFKKIRTTKTYLNMSISPLNPVGPTSPYSQYVGRASNLFSSLVVSAVTTGVNRTISGDSLSPNASIVMANLQGKNEMSYYGEYDWG